MNVGIAADHGGFELKEKISILLKSLGFEVKDYGAYQLDEKDDYPDYVIPLASAVANQEVEKAIAVCGSGVGACIAANKVIGTRAAIINEVFSARQGVEDDDMNMICLGGRVIGHAHAYEIVKTFLAARFSGAERHKRRLAKIIALEMKESNKHL
ncbi:MAG: RpiB/LacA/LacB family sugar-phosphate isomerase [Candidatus Cyclobacteriaceae bacterium M3_2C_046]